MPDDADIQKALPLCSSDGVTIDGQDITLPSDDIQFDVGAIAKGYIADRLKDLLVKKGVKSAIINLGGNVLCIGSKPDGTPFKVGIQKPFADRNETEAVMDITGKSVVSSGIYERCFKQDGKLYHHILNPQNRLSLRQRPDLCDDHLRPVCRRRCLKHHLFRPWSGGRTEICGEKRSAGCFYH